MDSNIISLRNRATALASIVCCMCSCKILPEVCAFTPLQSLKQTCMKNRGQHQSTNIITLLQASIDDDSENDTSYGDDDALLNELRDKKKEAFGKDIPSNEELQQAAKNAENAFLAAMLEQTQTFKEIKLEKGGDAAVSEFRKRIQEGDEAQRLELEKELEDLSDAASEELMVREQLVQQMEEGIMEQPKEENSDDSWQ